MGETDWTFASDSLAAASIARGVTGGIDRPNGGGAFLYGFASQAVVTGAVALFANQTNFAPTPLGRGGRINAAIQRGPSGGAVGFAPFIFLGLQGASVNDEGYLLGLMDDDPGRIALRKGRLLDGIPNDVAGASGILRRGTNQVEIGEWVHLQLDMIVNPNGDVILKAKRSDLDSNPVTAPVWEDIPGVDDFIDDALGVNSGSAPFLNSRFGFGFQSSDTTRRGYVDHVEVFRQL